MKKLWNWIVNGIKETNSIGWMSLIFTVAGFLFVGKQLLSIENNNAIIGDDNRLIATEIDGSSIEGGMILGDNSSISNIDDHSVNNSYYSDLIDENTSEDTLLQYAENAFISGDYEEVVKIYSMDRVKDNPVALNNIGYFYANGIYFPEDVESADDYYNRAISAGSKKALENKLALHLRNHLSDSVDIMREGYENRCVNVMALLSYYIWESNPEYSLDEIEEKRNWLLYNASDTEKEEFLNAFYKWEDGDTVYLSYSPADSDLIKYIFIDERSWVNTQMGTAGTTKIYRKYELRCVGIETLDEDVERLEQ